MKRSIVALVTLILLSVVASLAQQSGWEWQNPLPQGNTLNDIWCFDSQNFLLVGNGGTIMRTSDQGETWSVQNHTAGITNNLRGVFFVSQMEGWVVGDSAVELYTFDGGEHWLRISTGQNFSGHSIEKIHFSSSSIGWAAGTIYNNHNEGVGGFIWKTTTGGAWWDVLLTSSPGIHDIRVLSDSELIAVGDSGMIFQTTNSGVAWNVKNIGSVTTLRSLIVCPPDTVFVAGDYRIARSIDHGSTWSTLISPNEHINSLTFLTSLKGWAAGDRGNVYHTTDGGTTWSVDTLEEGWWMFHRIKVATNGVGLAVGNPGLIYKTTDQGESWTRLTTGPVDDLGVVYFASRTEGWVGSSWSRSLMHTTDGGLTWDYRDNPNYMISAISFGSPSTGWFVGGYSIVKTTNAGRTLQILSTPPPTHYLTGVFFIDSTTGWICGDGGTIMKTTNGGESWSQQGDSLWYNIYNIQFLSTSTGWALTGYGSMDADSAILKTTDGGETWIPHSVGTYTHLVRSIFFVNENIGYASGEGERIWKTTDGGLTWTKQHESGNRTLISIHATSPTHACAVGGGSYGGSLIFRTTDGGATWVEQESPNHHFLLDVQFIDDNSGWVVGYGGTILHTSSGGVPSFISVSSASLFWGGAVVGASKVDSVTVTNTGSTTELAISSVTSDNGEFLVSPPSAVIAPSESQKFSVTFSPTTIGAKNGIITFTDNAPGSPHIISVSGTAGIVVGRYDNRWNMISLSLTVPDASKNTLFPTAVSDAYSFQGTYNSQSSLSHGIGYWLKFNRAEDVAFNGTARSDDTVDVVEGWNLIGSISSPIAVSTISSMPGGLVTSDFYGYHSGYQVVDSLRPGYGYWVKMNNSGQLILSSSSIVDIGSSVSGRIRIVPTSELPPPPPDGMRNIVPTTFSLSQNFPNPFNPTTTIAYDVATTVNVTLKIYDVLGREVVTLVNEIKSPGSYSVQWNPTDKPSGIYFYRLSTSGYSITKKMVLMK